MSSLSKGGRRPAADAGSPPSPRPSGLRERKKARTRTAIQREALRLFRERGYSVTTVEQIAEAAEVAPSTVFRYFTTKEDLIRLDDDYSLLTKAFHAQPAELSPTRALRYALREMFSGQSSDELAERMEREMLIMSVPELWAANLSNITSTIPRLASLMAEHTDRSPDDPEVRSLTGAVCGVILMVWLDWAKNPSMDGPAVLDQALAHLEAGLPVSPAPSAAPSSSSSSTAP